jgi:hypothetical protein
LYYENEDHYKAFKELYRECDWPDKFNPLLFDSKRHEGGKKYGCWESTPRPTEREKSYAALPHLYQLMAVARDRVQQQIHLVDATYRLENNTDIDIWARQGLESQILNAENYLLKPRWKEDNDGLRTELEYRKADLQALRTRKGRYAGRGWAGVSDEEIKGLYEKAARETRIATIEALLQDEDLKSRNEREFREAKAAVAAAPAEAWEDMAADYKKWENDDWKDRWSILGSGTTLVDIRIVMDEDMSIEELERRIVYELEKNEDRSWRGKRLWRNDGGKVAIYFSPRKCRGLVNCSYAKE